MSTALLPPIPAPPHDPTSLLCDGRVGWPVLRADHGALESGRLSLARAPGSLRWMTEGGGSFGGLRPPANVALGRDKVVWLLDPVDAVLKRFDPCTCAFETVPCFGGEGSGARQLSDARGIALAGDRLYVADTGNARLGVFVLPTLALASHWTPGPRGPAAWLPAGVVVSRAGTVHVADPLNGMIHRFSPYGAYLGHWDGFGASAFLALAADGTVYAAGPLAAHRVGPGGRPEPVIEPADDLAARFPPSPFPVDAAGRLHLGPQCVPPSGVVFDLRGRAHPPAAGPVPDRYERAGSATLGPLDSRLDRCAWHRVLLRGVLPEGCRVRVATYTSEIELPASDLDQLPEHAWATRLECPAFEEGSWDGLIRSPAGRYLWLRVELRGNGRAAPRLESVEIEFPRISLRRYMPAVYGAEPESADFTDRFLALFDRALRDTERQVDHLAALFDPLSTPDLAWLAGWIGVEAEHVLPEDGRRSLVKRQAELAALRGTRAGLWRVLVAFLGLDRLRGTCQCVATPGRCRPAPATCPPSPPHKWSWDPPPLILEHYQLRRWLEIGVGRLGDQAGLWGRRIVNRSQLGTTAEFGVTQLKATQDPHRDPFHVYAHRVTVFVPASFGCTPERRRALERLLRREIPAHVDASVEYVEARFRIGFQSMIGLDTVVGRVPPNGVRVGETPIGPASVLTGDDAAVVDGSRIGTTAVLE